MSDHAELSPDIAETPDNGHSDIYPLSSRPTDPVVAQMAADMAEMKLTVSKTFEQTTWLCAMLANTLQTLPPAMRDSILKGSPS